MKMVEGSRFCAAAAAGTWVMFLRERVSQIKICATVSTHYRFVLSTLAMIKGMRELFLLLFQLLALVHGLKHVAQFVFLFNLGSELGEELAVYFLKFEFKVVFFISECIH